MSEIRKLSEEEIDVFTTIVINAYPGMKITSLEKREQLKTRILR